MSILGLALPFDFEQPQWLWLSLLVPVLVVASLRSLAGLSPVRRALSLIVRSLLVILLACCLARVQRVQRNEDLTVMFLMDRSHSVQALQEYQEGYIRAATKGMPAKDRVGMIDFARNAFLQQLPLTGGYYVEPGRLPIMPNTDRTDIASAVRLAMAMFPHDTAKRIVLLSDGNDNMGDLVTEARRAKADGIPVDVVPLWYEHRNEVYFERLIAPPHAEPGEQVPLRMVIGTNRAVSGRISIYHNGELINLSDQQARVTLQPGNNTYLMTIPIDSTGAQTYEARFQPDQESMDAIPLNNSARAFTFVSGSSRALLITANPLYDAPLAAALQSENVAVEMKSASELGEFGLLQMSNYSSILLANVPAAAFTDDQQEELAIYVKDQGGGLIMLGGDEGFGAGGWIGTPIEEVMPLSFEIKHKRVIPRGALVLIMHSCEIPRGNYWGKEMAKKSVDTVSSQDYLGILAYSYSPPGASWEVPLDRATNKTAVKAKIDRMQIGDMPDFGSTDFGSTMNMAFRELTRGRGRDAAQKHVIILSDGDASAPSSKLLADYVRAKITVSTIGIGWGAHVMDRTMRNIARKTGGKYYAAKNPRQLPQIFVKESKVVRRPLIIDEPFIPQVLHAHSELLTEDLGREVLPRLGGLVLTSPKQSPNVQVPLVRPTKDGNDPLLAHWQCELGKTVAFTSGYWPKWGDGWTRWPKFAKLWAQVVRWTMRQDAPANFDTFTKIEGNRGRIVIDALDKNADYLNFLEYRGKVIGPDNEAIGLQFVQTGPGHYEAEFDAERAGQYLGSIQIDEQGKYLGSIRTGLSVPFSPEYRDLTPNEALLRNVVDITGGRWHEGEPGTADIFSHDLPPTESKRPAWEWMLAWLVLPAFLLDVAVRRLASWLALSLAVEGVVLVVLLFGLGIAYGPWSGIVGALVLAELIGWTIRFRYVGPLFDFLTHGVTALRQAGDRSAVALEQLKDTRERVREDLTARSDEGLKRIAEDTGSIPLGVKRRRFDVGKQKGKQPVGDLHEALGAPKSTDPSADEQGAVRRKPAEAGEAAEHEDAVARLLRAKKRARRDMKEDE
jgi:uncharacterized membrane protein